MGMAEVIPGISGGTIALITGILNRFVEAIHSFNSSSLRLLFQFKLKQFLQIVQWQFLLMLFSGQFLGILLFTRIIPLPTFLRTYPEPMLALFFGLILASIILLARSAGKPDLKGLMSYLIGGIIGFLIVSGLQADTPESLWFVFLCGAIAICAWILPGISGSFVLLLLHKYDYIWEAITFHNDKSFSANLGQIILPFALGAIFGLMSFSRFLSFCLNKYPRSTTMGMNGLLIASLWAIFPFQNAIYLTMANGKEKLIKTTPYLPTGAEIMTNKGLISVFLILFGLSIVLIIDYLARKKKH